MVRLTSSVLVLFAIAAVAAGCGGTASARAASAPLGDAQAAFAQLPLTFAKSGGRFEAHGAGHAIAAGPRQVALALQRRPGRGVALSLRFTGANRHPVVAGTDRAPGTVNYLRGADPSRWRTNVPTYYGVVYRNLWPGIDLELSGSDGALKYEFRVRPGAGRRPSGSPTAARRACVATARARCRSRRRWASCATRPRSPTSGSVASASRCRAATRSRAAAATASRSAPTIARAT